MNQFNTYITKRRNDLHSLSWAASGKSRLCGSSFLGTLGLLWELLSHLFLKVSAFPACSSETVVTVLDSKLYRLVSSLILETSERYFSDREEVRSCTPKALLLSSCSSSSSVSTCSAAVSAFLRLIPVVCLDITAGGTSPRKLIFPSCVWRRRFWSSVGFVSLASSFWDSGLGLMDWVLIPGEWFKWPSFCCVSLVVLERYFADAIKNWTDPVLGAVSSASQGFVEASSAPFGDGGLLISSLGFFKRGKGCGLNVASSWMLFFSSVSDTRFSLVWIWISFLSCIWIGEWALNASASLDGAVDSGSPEGDGGPEENKLKDISCK